MWRKLRWYSHKNKLRKLFAVLCAKRNKKKHLARHYTTVQHIERNMRRGWKHLYILIFLPHAAVFLLSKLERFFLIFKVKLIKEEGLIKKLLNGGWFLNGPSKICILFKRWIFQFFLNLQTLCKFSQTSIKHSTKFRKPIIFHSLINHWSQFYPPIKNSLIVWKIC